MGGGGGADSSEPLFPISYPLSPVFSYSCALSCTFLHFFALVKITTLFFSWDCALFDQKTGGRDILLTSRAYTEFAWRLLANLSSKSASVDSALSAAGTSPTGSGCQFRFFCFTFNFKLSTFDLPASHQSRVTLLSIPQSAGFARRATHGRSTAHRSGIPCARPSLEFLRLDTCASFPSRWFRLRPA